MQTQRDETNPEVKPINENLALMILQQFVGKVGAYRSGKDKDLKKVQDAYANAMKMINRIQSLQPALYNILSLLIHFNMHKADSKINYHTIYSNEVTTLIQAIINSKTFPENYLPWSNYVVAILGNVCSESTNAYHAENDEKKLLQLGKTRSCLRKFVESRGDKNELVDQSAKLLLGAYYYMVQFIDMKNAQIREFLDLSEFEKLHAMVKRQLQDCEPLDPVNECLALWFEIYGFQISYVQEYRIKQNIKRSNVNRIDILSIKKFMDNNQVKILSLLDRLKESYVKYFLIDNYVYGVNVFQALVDDTRFTICRIEGKIAELLNELNKQSLEKIVTDVQHEKRSELQNLLEFKVSLIDFKNKLNAFSCPDGMINHKIIIYDKNKEIEEYQESKILLSQMYSIKVTHLFYNNPEILHDIAIEEMLVMYMDIELRADIPEKNVNAEVVYVIAALIKNGQYKEAFDKADQWRRRCLIDSCYLLLVRSYNCIADIFYEMSKSMDVEKSKTSLKIAMKYYQLCVSVIETLDRYENRYSLKDIAAMEDTKENLVTRLESTEFAEFKSNNVTNMNIEVTLPAAKPMGQKVALKVLHRFIEKVAAFKVGNDLGQIQNAYVETMQKIDSIKSERPALHNITALFTHLNMREIDKRDIVLNGFLTEIMILIKAVEGVKGIPGDYYPLLGYVVAIFSIITEDAIYKYINVNFQKNPNIKNELAMLERVRSCVKHLVDARAAKNDLVDHSMRMLLARLYYVNEFISVTGANNKKYKKRTGLVKKFLDKEMIVELRKQAIESLKDGDCKDSANLCEAIWFKMFEHHILLLQEYKLHKNVSLSKIVDVTSFYEFLEDACQGVVFLLDDISKTYKNYYLVKGYSAGINIFQMLIDKSKEFILDASYIITDCINAIDKPTFLSIMKDCEHPLWGELYLMYRMKIKLLEHKKAIYSFECPEGMNCVRYYVNEEDKKIKDMKSENDYLELSRIIQYMTRMLIQHQAKKALDLRKLNEEKSVNSAVEDNKNEVIEVVQEKSEQVIQLIEKKELIEVVVDELNQSDSVVMSTDSESAQSSDTAVSNMSDSDAEVKPIVDDVVIKSIPWQIPLPEYVGEIFDKLNAIGKQAWLVGGAVRDLEPKDYDIVTTASMAEVQTLFGSLGITVGNQHPVYQINGDKLHKEIQIGLLSAGVMNSGNKEEVLLSNGKTVKVYRGNCIIEDAKTRVLTCNALYYDANKQEVIDPTGMGFEDVENKKIRFITNADAVMQDDPAFVFRIMRLIAKHGYSFLDYDIEQHILNSLPGLFSSNIKNPARINSEISKTLTECNSARILKLFWHYHIFSHMYGFNNIESVLIKEIGVILENEMQFDAKSVDLLIWGKITQNLINQVLVTMLQDNELLVDNKYRLYFQSILNKFGLYGDRADDLSRLMLLYSFKLYQVPYDPEYIQFDFNEIKLAYCLQQQVSTNQVRFFNNNSYNNSYNNSPNNEKSLSQSYNFS